MRVTQGHETLEFSFNSKKHILVVFLCKKKKGIKAFRNLYVDTGHYLQPDLSKAVVAQAALSQLSIWYVF